MNPFANEFPEHVNDILFWIISKMVVSKQVHLSQRQRETDPRGEGRRDRERGRETERDGQTQVERERQR